MKRLAVVVIVVVLGVVAAWGLQPRCGTGSQIAEANVLWSEQRVLLLVNEVRITQSTNNFGVIRQNIETWLGGLVQPTQTCPSAGPHLVEDVDRSAGV
jgi:hypothetical protein